LKNKKYQTIINQFLKLELHDPWFDPDFPLEIRRINTFKK